MELRLYQKDAIASIMESQKETNKILISLATGTGKTIIFTTLSRDYLVTYDKKVLIIAHTEELLIQAKEKYAAVASDLCVYLDQGSNRLTPIGYMNAHVVIASVQTLGRAGTDRLSIYKPEEFAAVIVDEAHRSLSASYIRVLEHFGVSKHPPEKDSPYYEEYLQFKGDQKGIVEWKGGRYDWNKECLLLGVTATPMRTKEGESLKYVYDLLAYKYDLIDAIKDGWLCNIHSLVAKTKTNLTSIKMQGGDYNQKDLSGKVNTDGRNSFIVETYLDQAQPGATLVFAVDIAHTKALQKRFKESGISAEIVDGSLPKEQRRDIIERFKNDQIPVLINCQVLTEGFDAPNIKNILMARPTQSTIFYMQAIGRGTRLHPGKEKCLVIDFVDNISRHNPLTLKYILGIPEGKKVAREEQEEAKDLKKQLEVMDEAGGDVLSQLSLSAEELFGEEQGDNSEFQIIDKGLILAVTEYVKENFLGKSKYTWLKIFENTWFLPFPNYQEFNTKQGKLKFYQSRLKLVEEWEEWKLYFEAMQMNKQKVNQLIGRYKTIHEIDTRVSAMILDNGIEAMFLKRNQRWHKDIISDGQKDFIIKLLANYNGKKQMLVGKDDLAIMNKGEAGLLINILRYQIKI